MFQRKQKVTWRHAGAALVALWLCLGASSAGAQQGPTLNPVGRQFLELGVQASAWVGQGSVRSVPEDGGQLRGEYDAVAVGAGPFSVGFSHVVSLGVMLESRVGVGAMWFSDDRLIHASLPTEGDSHLGFVWEVELLGRFFNDAGWTAALGLNMGSVGLPKERAALFRLSPRLGYLSWDQGYTGYWLVEVGYQLPVIGPLPDVPDAGVRSPVESTWHSANLAITWGF
jgi:hypothetical protein